MKKPMALILALAIMVAQSFAAVDKRPKSQSLTEEQRIIHVLNRLGFGARPGDV